MGRASRAAASRLPPAASRWSRTGTTDTRIATLGPNRRIGLGCGLLALAMLLCSSTSTLAQVSVGIGVPGISIGINLPAYPQMAPVPGYPVYYAPRVNANYFFYDGMYWVYQHDNWYASSWYNGPWGLVSPAAVPLFMLRVPVRYYRQPPVYFRGWSSNEPPHWGAYWGNDWEQHRRGWDEWNRRAAPRPAPLPVYQRQYSGNRYPGIEQQQQLEGRNYRYAPRDAQVQQHYQTQRAQSAAAPSPQRTAQPRPQAPSGHVEGRGPQGKGPEGKGPQGNGPQGKDRGPQGNGTAMESRQGQEQRGTGSEQPGGDHNR
jgi:hypothetical protein